MKKYLLYSVLLVLIPICAHGMIFFSGKQPAPVGASCTGNYGNTDTGAFNEGGAQYLMILHPVTIDCSSSSYTINVYGHNAYEGQYKLAIFTRTGVGTGSLVEGSTAITTPNNEDVGWLNGDSYAFTASLSAGDYYIGILTDASYLGIYAEAETGGGAVSVNVGSFTVPASLSGMTARTWDMCMYIGF